MFTPRCAALVKPEKPINSREKKNKISVMKNFNISNLELKELNTSEIREIEGGYQIGDVITDSNGNMYRCDFILPGGLAFWTKLEGNVC